MGVAENYFGYRNVAAAAVVSKYIPVRLGLSSPPYG
jgi:hypothetical protein